MGEEDSITVKKEDCEENPKDDEDLLYTHKPENQGSSIQWNSAFCRRPGH